MEGQMAIEILESRENKLIERKELIVRISHWPQGTPSRKEVRERIAKLLGVDPNLVYIRRLKTEYGMCESLARVHVYQSLERALKFEPKHIIRRDSGGEAEKGAGEG